MENSSALLVNVIGKDNIPSGILFIFNDYKSYCSAVSLYESLYNLFKDIVNEYLSLEHVESAYNLFKDMTNKDLLLEYYESLLSKNKITYTTVSLEDSVVLDYNKEYNVTELGNLINRKEVK